MSEFDLEADIEELIERNYVGVTNFPSLQFFMKNYAKALPGSDGKAIQLFNYYESLEKKRSLQRELFQIRNGAGSIYALEKILGPKRKSALGNYEAWALKLLVMLSSSQKVF